MEKESSFQQYISKPEVNLFLSILIPLVALGISWGILTARLDHVENMALGLQDTYKQQTQTNEDIKVALARIQTDILYIRQEMDRHLIMSVSN